MFRAFCIGVNTPRSLKAWLLVENKEFEQLAKMRIHPLEYLSADGFAVDYAVSTFLKKNKDIPWSNDTRTPAIAAFKSSERNCRRANRRLKLWSHGRLNFDRGAEEALHLAQRKISKLLGDARPFGDSGYSWGPGATFDLAKRRAYPDTKLVELPFTVTGSAWKHACEMIDADLHWKAAIISHNSDYTGPIFRIVPGGRYDTVPKTVLTDRSILVEPRLNTVLQKRVGKQLRVLLKRVGVDLDDQSRNQSLASFARALGLATLDLEAASDSVSREIVKFLLPPDWFEVLDELRSPWVQMDSGWVRLEKFSSMGNGFTFELESLIFWALASAASDICQRTTVGVYGDDIIVHQDVAPLLIETLTTAGFSLNKEKSFVSGEFFESCGRHYFGDQDVTPIYQKEVPRDGAQAARLGNRLLRYAARLGCHVTFDKRVRGAWEEWRRSCDPSPDQLGPYLGVGDGYWESPDALLSTRTRPGHSGVEYRVACYSAVKRVIPANDDAMYAIWLQKSSPGSPPGERYRRGKMHPDSYRNDVSITGRGRKLRISSTAESGFLDSREVVKMSRRHSWIQSGPLSTALSW